MREWTDRDYAQAAIDMLPGTVEEIEEFLLAQGVKSKWVGTVCPIQRFTNKWVDGRASVGAYSVGLYSGYVWKDRLDLPQNVREYIRYVDSQKVNGL